MISTKTCQALGLTLMLVGTTAGAGVLDPDCDAKDAARSTAMKATVGVGGRCSPKEAVTDITKDAVGIDKKGPLKKNRNDHGIAKKATKKALD